MGFDHALRWYRGSRTRTRTNGLRQSFIYGDGTYNAVYNFQVAHDEILDDGVIGPETASRITFAASDKAGEWYGWASSWNLLPSRTGKFGRRTNPYDEIYYSDPLTDYVCITLKTKHKVKTLKILGSMLDNQTASITRITAGWIYKSYR